jgi:hypothetical protein
MAPRGLALFVERHGQVRRKLMIVRAVERAAGWRIRSSLISFGEFVA